MSAQAIATPVLADYVPGQRVRAAALMGIGAVVLAVCAQVAVPLPFTPVPVSLATFAVILLGASMGPALGAGSVLVYLIAGLAGAPIFAEQASGWAFASFGDRKSTRLNSSHVSISYAVFCLKKKNKQMRR